MKVISKKALN